MAKHKWREGLGLERTEPQKEEETAAKTDWPAKPERTEDDLPPVPVQIAETKTDLGIVANLIHQVDAGFTTMPEARANLAAWVRNVPSDKKKEIYEKGRERAKKLMAIAEALYQTFFEASAQ